MRRRRVGFTLVELLVVIAIIAVLIGIVVLGLTSYQRRINERDTRATLQSLAALLKEDVRSLPAPAGLSNPLSVTDVTIGGNDRMGLAVQYTRSVLARLRAVPANKAAVDKFPSDKLWTFGGTSDPVPLDAWGNPIIYVPTALRVTIKNQTVIIRAPNGRPFWASAGADGNFYQFGDDNVYSFQ